MATTDVRDFDGERPHQPARARFTRASEARVPPVMPEWLAVAVLLLTGTILGVLMALAGHRTHLLLLSRRPPPPVPRDWAAELPRVTVQLPLFNEATVVERLLEAVARLDYPADRLQVQVLDDSTDDTRALAERAVARLRAEGLAVEHRHREVRTGFKAGALQEALASATGEYVLVLDADFVPSPSLVRRLLPPFRDPGVGMVQARWDHLNADVGLLTRCQSLLLDAHFFFEQGGRWAGGRFMSFNGTGGMWRRAALEAAGGWSWDTLTEDLDVSYRAQMAGWRFVFLPEVGVPGEIPEEVGAFEGQQKRWAQGGVQVARKMLPHLWRGAWPRAVKAEGSVHLLAHLAHPLTLLLGLLLLPSAVARTSLGLDRLLVLDALVFAGATLSFLLFYSSAGRMRGSAWRTTLPQAVATLALGVGLTATVSRSVVRGLVGGARDPFVRTPKRGEAPGRYRSPRGLTDRLTKGLLFVWMAVCTGAAVSWGYPGTVPFLLLFGVGYGWLFFGDLVGGRVAG